MPFGAVFASLLLGLVGVFLPISALGAGSAPTALGRVALGLICLNVSLGLLRRQAWARWGALFVGAALLALHDLLAPPGGAVAKLAILFGAVISILLLALPATGKLEPSGGAKKAGALALASGLGVIALVFSLVWGAFVETREPLATEAPIQIAGLSPRVDWKSYDEALELAQTHESPVFVVFETDWCGYCKKMNRTTFKDPRVVDRLNELVAVRVDAEDDAAKGEFSGRELARRYGVAGYPALMVLDPKGAVQSRASGYLGAAEFLAWVEEGVNRPSRRRQGAARSAP